MQARNRPSQQFSFQPIHHSQLQQSRNLSGEQSPLHLGGHMGSATTPTNGAQHGEGASGLSNDDIGPNVPKKSLPANGKKTKGRVKIKMEFIDNKLRRYTTFSKRKTGIMKKAYELSTLTGTQVMLLVASETGHVYTFATRKLQPMITSEAGKALIQTCLNSPDPPPGPGGSSGLDQRMSATGFEETDLTYSVGDDCEKIPDGMGGKGIVYSLEASPPSGDASPSHPALHLSVGSRSSPPSSPAAASSSSASCSPSHQMISNLSSSALLQQPSSSQLSNANSTGFATILATASPGSALSPSVQIGTFHPSSTETTSSAGQAPQVYRIPAQGSGAQAFSLSISGPSKSSSTNSSTSTQSQVIPNSSHQNLSLVSGNVVIPAGQTILQAGNANGAFMYHTGQGLVYATPTTLSEGGVILNIGQEQGGTPQQFITIPVSLSLTPAQQQQLMHVSPTALATTCQVTGCSPAKSHKSRK